MALLRRLTGQENQVSWAVVDAGTGAFLGSLSVYKIDEAQAGAQIGYWTTPAARGRGVAAVAVDTAARWVFGTLAVDRIELCHAVENVASGRVAEKAGFTPRRAFAGPTTTATGSARRAAGHGWPTTPSMPVSARPERAAG